jgi:phage baseplate assembly protein gpV
MSDFNDPIASLLRPRTVQTREQRVHSITTALVERIEDDGMYRLRIFGMNFEVGEDDTSAPARVMMPMAGNRRGFHFLPEVGDEVVVAFQDGDNNHPIILGGVWNSASPPPDQAKESADNNLRTIVSRSGHEVTFDDTRGSEKVTIKSQGGHTIELDDAPGRPTLTLSSHLGARRIVIDDTPPGSLTVQTPTCRIGMSEPGSISLQAAIAISLNAPAVSINGIPFLTHTHGVPPGPVTPPVTPVP